MEKLRALILDDTKKDLDDLIGLLHKYQSDFIEVVSIGQSYDEALRILNRNHSERFDISFLDINLGVHTSFELIERFPFDIFGLIVFFSREEVPKSIIVKAHPVSYLEKPFNDESFIESFIKIKRFLKGKQTKIGIVDENYKMIFLDLMSIYYITTERNKCSKVHFWDSKNNRPDEMLSRKELSEIAKQLDPNVFTKCNGSTLINTMNVIGIGKAEKEVIFEKEHFNKKICFSDTYRDTLIRLLES